MNEHSNAKNRLVQSLSGHAAQYRIKIIIATLGFAMFAGGPVLAADPAGSAAKKSVATAKFTPVSTEIAPRMEFALGQSHLIRMPSGVNLRKVKVDDDKVVQVEVTSPREIVLYGKSVGTTTLMIWDKSGQVTIVDVSVVGATVGMDATSLQGKIRQVMPTENGIMVSTAGGSLVLSGVASDAVKVDQALALAEAYAGKDKKVINMLRVGAPQQVMLEVKMAEVSKNLLDQLGVGFNVFRKNGGIAYDVIGNFAIDDALGTLTFRNGATEIKIKADKNDTIIKMLAEPNIIAISGQEGSFLAGGKFFIPVPQAGSSAGAVTLEEKDFGVGLKFTPTVLENGLINLRVAPEVTELSTISTPISEFGSAKINSPTLTTRRVSTTVQLHDGQSFAIAGLLKSNINEDVKRFPILGEIPILGALFRSSSFKNDKTELLFVVTPRLVKPLPANYALPTDNFKEPTRKEFFLDGKMEGQSVEPAALPSGTAAPATAPATTQESPKDGFEMK